MHPKRMERVMTRGAKNFGSQRCGNFPHFSPEKQRKLNVSLTWGGACYDKKRATFEDELELEATQDAHKKQLHVAAAADEPVAAPFLQRRKSQSCCILQTSRQRQELKVTCCRRRRRCYRQHWRQPVEVWIISLSQNLGSNASPAWGEIIQDALHSRTMS